MAEQQSRLAIIIDSTGAKRNVDGLAGALEKMTQAGQKAADSADKTSKATKDEASALSALLDRIDPVNAALNRLDEQQRQLAKFQAKGFLDTDTFNQYSQKIEQTRDSLTKYADSAGKAGASSKQLAASMRMVPAQMTDIIVGLASGQAPMTVLLQQGGQLKDMFGGIGPAIRGVGTYVAGLINPFTLVAGALATTAAAFYQNEQEIDALNRAANTLSNTSGLNLSQMQALAHSASALGVSYGDAVEAVGQLSQSINTNTNLYPEAIRASSEYADASGQNLSKVIGMFNQLSANGGKSIDELDDKFGFLTAAQREQADAALRGGNTADAQRIAFEGLTARLDELTKKLNLGASGWDKFWNAAGKGVSGGWEVFKEIVGGDYFNNRDIEKYQQQTKLRAQKTEAGTWTAEDEAHYQGVVKASPAVKAYAQAQSEANEATKEAASNQYLKSLNKQVNDNADAVTKARVALDKFRNEYNNQPDDIKKQGAAAYKVGLAQYQKKYDDAVAAKNKKDAPKKGKAYTEDAGTKMLDQLRQQQAALTAQYDTGDKLSTQAQALVKWEQQLADLKSKKTLTADQKSLLANSDAITAQLQKNAAIEKEIQQKQTLAQLDKARAEVQKTLDNASAGYSLDLALSRGNISQREQQQQQQRLSLEQSWNDKIIQLRQSRAQATSDIAREEIDQEIQLQQQALQMELSNYDDHIARMNQLRGSFTAGASRAWQEYQDSAANVSAMSQQLFTDAFGGMEDALVNFVVTGKASFKDFATSVISDLARIAARQALVGLGSSLFGSLFSAGASAAGSAASSAGGLGLSTDFHAYAKGGVPGGQTISAFRNGVYDSPQYFAFAKGAGVFGEAGPEAIMPLARSSDGSLGVRMISGGGGGGNISVSAPVTIVQQSDGSSGDVSNANTAAAGKQLEAIVQTTLTDRLRKEIAPGGLLYRSARG